MKIIESNNNNNNNNNNLIIFFEFPYKSELFSESSIDSFIVVISLQGINLFKALVSLGLLYKFL